MIQDAFGKGNSPEAAIRAKLASIGAPASLVRFFLGQVHKLIHRQEGILSEANLLPVGDLPNLDSLQQYEQIGQAHLSKVVIIKLNGGLGTTMGLDSTKSLLIVKDGLTFLEIAFRQVRYLRKRYRAPIPLVLMNSFYTDEETQNFLQRHKQFIASQSPIPISFTQHRVPKLHPETLEPIEYSAKPLCEWCPPGHGDLYLALQTSGLLDVLLDSGIVYAFVSNSDNLAATLDFRLLGYLAARKIPFLMEVTRRTHVDRKGGHLAKRRDGQFVLREAAQCPAGEMDSFTDIQRHPYFNTNNLWIHLPSLAHKLQQEGGFLDLPLIVNKKPVNPQDPSSPLVLQLECAMGAAIQVFPKAEAVLVPRARFSPVKNTEDLLALWSDAFLLQPDGRVVLHPKRNERPVLVQLDRTYYWRHSDLLQRFPYGAPSLVECDLFRVEGDFKFGRNIVCRGTVTCRNNDVLQKTVPDGTVLDGEYIV